MTQIMQMNSYIIWYSEGCVLVYENVGISRLVHIHCCEMLAKYACTVVSKYSSSGVVCRR